MPEVDPHPDYPPEDGGYLWRNQYSPFAMAFILNCVPDKFSTEPENDLRAGKRPGQLSQKLCKL
jgi:hypothetical protein